MTVGLYKLVLPVKYMTETASEDDKKVFELYKTAFDKCMSGEQGGMIFPAVTDNNGNYLFDLQYVGPESITVNKVLCECAG